MPPVVPPTAPDASLLERVQSFVAEHRRAVLLGTAAAVVVAGTAAYYASSSRGASRPDNALEDVAGDGKKKKKAKSKKPKADKGKDSPILEERKPKVEGAVDEGACWHLFYTLLGS